MLAELTRFHGENSIPGCGGKSVVWRRIGPIFILLIFWAVAARIFDIFVKRGGKTHQKCVFCIQCNCWCIFSRFQANSPSLRHLRTIWDAKSEIRIFWNGSQNENTSLQNYRYHEKSAKLPRAMCFRQQACPHICDTIGYWVTNLLTYR